VSGLLRWVLLAGIFVIIGLYVFTDSLVALWLFVALEVVGLLIDGVSWLRTRSEN